MLRTLTTSWAHGWTAAQRLYAVDVVRRAARDVTRQEGPTVAAAVSYDALLSFFPLTLAAVAIAGWFIRSPALQAQLVDGIVAPLPPEANLAPQVEAVEAGVAGTESGVLGLVSLLGGVWTASGLFGALRRALNRAFDVPAARSFVHGKALDLLSLFGVLLFALLSVAATTALGVLRAVADDRVRGVVPSLVWGLASVLLPLALSFLTFLAVYRLIPNRTVGGAAVWLGALLAAVGFEVAQAGFGLYVATIGR